MPGETDAPETVVCRVNGLEVKFRGDLSRSTVDALRERGLHGVRETCGLGLCGSCTILLDGAPVSACILPTFALDQREVTTVEGMATSGELSQLQRQFIESQAFQCSFCTPGFLASAQALLEATVGELSRHEVEEGLSGHLCRCGSYEPIVEAVQKCSRERPAEARGDS